MIASIHFKPLSTHHFPQLLQWLESPPIKTWWDTDIRYDLHAVREKFGSYIHQNLSFPIVQSSVYAYIIYAESAPIGYIQTYQADVYKIGKYLELLLPPGSIAGLDFFIGEEAYLNQGLGSKILLCFWEQVLKNHFKACIVDPATNNIRAIKAYQKAGFYILPFLATTHTTVMIKNKHTTIIYLIGKPGSGKYTIAQELAKFGYVVCDNHLINNPIFGLLKYRAGAAKIPQSAWEAIDKIRTAVFDFMVQERKNNYVLTSVLYEVKKAHELYKKTEEMALRRRSIFVPIKLSVTEQENIKRIIIPTRQERGKAIDPHVLHNDLELIHINHPNLLALDITALSANEAAKQILSHINNLIAHL